MGNAIFCPECSKDDQIQKVSAIYHGGTTTTSLSGVTTTVSSPVGSNKTQVGSGYSTMSGVSQTNLSSLLAPPAHPGDGSLGCWWGSLFAIVLSVFAIIVVWVSPIEQKRKVQITVVAGLALLGAVVGPVGNSNIAYRGAIVFIVIAMLSSIILYIVGLYEEQKRRKIVAGQQVIVWKTKMQKWDSLYYCHRNGCVFDPNTGQSVPVHQMNALIG